MTFGSLQLRYVLTITISALSCALILLFVVTIGRSAQNRVTEEVGHSMLVLADQMQDKLDRALYERAREIENASSLVRRLTAGTSAEDITVWLNEMQKGYPDYAWIGFASSDGRVRNATGSVLLGADVAEQPWFRDGSRALTVGDVHDDPMFSSVLVGGKADSHRYIWISAPVMSANAAPAGVIGALLNWAWVDEVRDSLFGTAGSKGSTEVFVLNKERDVLMGTPDLTGRKLELPNGEALAGASRYVLERWPDGRDYVTGIARSDGYRNFAGLGWTVLVRQDADEALAPVHRLQRLTLLWAVGLAAIGSIAAWLLAKRVSTPLLRLATSAEAIRKGNRIEIPDLHDFSEVATLSRSLSTLVSELKQRQSELTALNLSLETQVSDRTAELMARNSALISARHDAESATAAKSRFLAAASHDLRQPLHAMTLFARALSRRVSGDEAPRLVQQLELSLVSLKNMFDALLNVSRLDAGLIEPQIGPVVISDLVQRLAVASVAEARARNLDFKWTSIDTTLQTDATLLETILRNLVSNALKFTKSGGVLLASRMRSGRVAFVVLDTGNGIPPEEQATIFGEFERAKEDARGPNEGLGLGLSLVRRYASLLGAEVTVASRPGRGTAFQLLMPAQTAIDTSAHQTPLAQKHVATLRPNLRVLLLDDDRQILDAMTQELSDRTCQVKAFHTIDDAVTVMRAGWHPDVAIVDYNLGGAVTGVDALERLERISGFLPALVLTGGTDARTLSLIASSGRPYLVKPADPDEVAANLEQLSKHSGPLGEAP